MPTSPVEASSSLATRQGAHNGHAPAVVETGPPCSLLYSASNSNDRSPMPPCPARSLPTGRRLTSVRSDRNQADLPTQEEVPTQDARVPHPHVDARWSPGSQGASSQGAQAPHPRAFAVISRHRLRGRRRFAAVRALGLRASSAGVRAQLAANEVGVPRVGFALVGMRSAVRRNLLRRRLRAAVRPLLTTVGGHDLVLLAGREALELPFAALCAAVADATGRALERGQRAQVASTADNGSMPESREQRR